MDEFKKKLQARQILVSSGFLFSCGAIMLTRNVAKEVSASEHLQGLIDGFQVGAVIGLLGVLVLFFVKNIMAMKSPERMKKMYISETDERKLLILQKSGSVGMNIVMYGLALGTAVAGNISDTVFLTLLSACLFVSIVRGILKFYYFKKY